MNRLAVAALLLLGPLTAFLINSHTSVFDLSYSPIPLQEVATAP